MNSFATKDRYKFNYTSHHYHPTQQTQQMLFQQLQQLRQSLENKDKQYARQRQFKQKTFLQYQFDKNRQIQQLKLHFQNEINLIREQQDERLIKTIQLNKQLQKQLELWKQGLSKMEDKLQQKNQQLARKNNQINQLNKCLQIAESNVMKIMKQFQNFQKEVSQKNRRISDNQKQYKSKIKQLQSLLIRSQSNEKARIEQLKIISFQYEKLQHKLKDFQEKNSNIQDLRNLVQKMTKQMGMQQLDMKKQFNQRRKLEDKLQQYEKMQQAKAREIAELMNENQRLYTQVNLKRRLISQLAITYNFSI